MLTQAQMRHARSSHQPWWLVAALALFVLTPSAHACTVYGKGWGSKWDDPVWPNSAIITWSFMTPGVALGPLGPPAWSGTNSLGSGAANDIRVIIDNVHGAGAFDAAVQRAFATWTAAANLQFTQVADQGGNFGTVTAPDIRIGAFSFGVGDPAGGAGFGPPGNDISFPDAIAGDIALNDLNNFNIDPGSEGDLLQTGTGGIYLNDIEGLLLHEIGHTLGVGHSRVTDAVLCGFLSPAFNGQLCDFSRVNRVLEPDDLNAIRNIYGPAPPPDGDISFDCTVDAADALLVNQVILGLLAPNGAQFTRADVASPLGGALPSPDGLITMSDLMAIMQKGLKKINF